ncbi:MAG: hypothetical protein M1820_001907 [Bogoriella megaspora]|nr:MAG: hypothetical protein M1820_001907 [Bogoriella megaspora]
MRTRQFILVEKPVDEVDINKIFKLIDAELPPLKEGQVLIKLHYIAHDPAIRGWIDANSDKERMYMPIVEPGELVKAGGLGEVVESKSTKLPVGTLVQGFMGWAEYVVMDESECLPVQEIEGLDIALWMGPLGFTGMTAWYGLEVIRASKEDKVFVVTAAAGATGHVAVQLAKKVFGCQKVIAITSSAAKCQWVESLGADVGLNYNDPDFVEQLDRATGKQVDVLFDNVGGWILDLMLHRMKRHSRVLACGAISTYNSRGKDPMRLPGWYELIIQRIEVRGFVIFDAAPRYSEILQGLIQAWKDGKLKLSDGNIMKESTGLEKVPQTWLKLFNGEGRGKVVTQLVTSR